MSNTKEQFSLHSNTEPLSRSQTYIVKQTKKIKCNVKFPLKKLLKSLQNNWFCVTTTNKSCLNYTTQ